jgi:hypothetical protein
MSSFPHVVQSDSSNFTCVGASQAQYLTSTGKNLHGHFQSLPEKIHISVKSQSITFASTRENSSKIPVMLGEILRYEVWWCHDFGENAPHLLAYTAGVEERNCVQNVCTPEGGGCKYLRNFIQKLPSITIQNTVLTKYSPPFCGCVPCEHYSAHKVHS